MGHGRRRKRAHDDIPRYIKGFDVGIVPYLLTEYTANVYPTKLNEYLAMGIPVVATDLPVSGGVLYELWLLDSARGQMSLGTFAPDPDGEATVAIPMPVVPAAYTYLDVSREPRDGDPAHSGQSILRAPTGP